MGGLDVTDVRGEPIPLLWSTRTLVGEKALAKGFCSDMGDTKNDWGCLEGVHIVRSEK